MQRCRNSGISLDFNSRFMILLITISKGSD